jgi:hypothetical protein
LSKTGSGTLCFRSSLQGLSIGEFKLQPKVLGYFSESERLTSIGPMIMLVFFGMLVFGYIYVYFAIPETKGLTLEEVIIHARCKLLPI